LNEQDSNVRVVGIGASAGGIDALKDFFAAMPADTGMAFVVIQHLDPDHVSYMAGLLARHITIAVAQAEDGMEVRANSVYTIPPNTFLFIKEGKLHLTEPIKRDGIRMPIDFFFRSLAQDQHEKAIAVLLSGSGSDGTLGIREVHGAGGIVLVQDPATAQFDFMLHSAMATGLVDCVLPAAQLPAAILDYALQSDGAATSLVPETVEDSVRSILEILASQSKNNFQAYRKPTVWRRIQRRMGLNQMADISDYARFLRESRDEVARLSKDMLIGVTSFFRDPEAFEELRAKVIVPLVEKKASAAPLRAWTAGCSTGEEVYSIAIMMREEMMRNKNSFPLQLFASDIDTEGLKCAREAIYPESIASDVSEERLARFFIKKDGSYQINKEIRESVTFAAHNLLVDPPFMKMDLISCRNLLIYIEREMQKKLCTLFAFALNPGGYLFLGKADSIDHQESFETVSRNSRIYLRKESAAAPAVSFPTRAGVPLGLQARIEKQPSFRLSDLNQDVLLKHFDAAVVLIDERGNSLHFYGPTHKYLALPTGDASLSLFEMIEKRHSSKLRLAVDSAVRENGTVTLEGLEFSRDDSTYVVNVTVSCVEPKAGARLLAVIFQEARQPVTASPARTAGAEIPGHDAYIAQLEADIKSLKEELQTATDGFQTSHEELTAANEEVLAINEELQSTNEELETSKEELQSVNEELVTVNNQLNEKFEELGQTNDDLANFLNSSEVGTIFLDTRFCIRRFTPATTKLLSLLPLDVGRPVEHISNRFIDVSLTAVADSVLKNLTAIEKEVRSADGLWYLMRCLPYRTLGNKIGGVVFTFTDVTGLKEAQNYAESIVRTIRESLIILTPELKVVSANRAFYETFQVSPEETENRLIYELGNRQWDIPRLREVLEDIRAKDSSFQDFEAEHDFPSIGKKIMSLNARRIDSRAKNEIQLILLAIDDITERKKAEQELYRLNQELETRVSERTGELQEANRALVRDMEERKRLEQQLLQAQKLESVGTLAGGIAHDFNNMLNIIQGHTYLLSEQAARNEEIAEPVAAINETVKRASAVVQQLLTLARKTESKFEPVDANTLLESLIMLLRETFAKTVEVTLDRGDMLPPVIADPNQIMQVLLNLCLNARDAMPDGGKLTLKTQAVDGESLRDLGEATAARYVCIEVADTGTGMDENVQRRIFEPFFTTKETGHGTGLGLAVVYGIVKSHNGFIRVMSKPMEGAIFRVYLPIAASGQ
jgi:two-component system, chemotaxis family, CheB/CheR fusion protein